MSTSRFLAGGVALLALLGASLAITPANAGGHCAEFGVQAGLHAPDEHLTGEEDFLDEIVGGAGLRVGVLLAERWGVAADVFRTSTRTAFPTGDAEVSTVRAAIEWFASPHGSDRPQFFVSGGIGAMSVDPDDGDSFGRPFAAVGLGQRVPLDSHFLFRWELRADATFHERDDEVDEDMIQGEVLVGLALGFGGGAPPAAPEKPDPAPEPEPTPDPAPDPDPVPSTPPAPAPIPEPEPETAEAAAPLFEPGRTDLILEGVTFRSGSAVVTIESQSVLDRVAESLIAWPDVRVEVGGHTDSQGDDAQNLTLSDQRAKSVMRYLYTRGVSFTRIEAKGYGETQPVAGNETESGRSKNRRVELRKID